jgi:hypothetical protein
MYSKNPTTVIQPDNYERFNIYLTCEFQCNFFLSLFSKKYLALRYMGVFAGALYHAKTSIKITRRYLARHCYTLNTLKIYEIIGSFISLLNTIKTQEYYF